MRVEALRAARPRLEAEASRPDLWNDQDRARAVTSELAAVTEDVEFFDRLAVDLSDAETLHQLAVEEADESQGAEIAAAVSALDQRLDDLELRSLFSGEFDERDAVCQIKSGEGGYRRTGLGRDAHAYVHPLG